MKRLLWIAVGLYFLILGCTTPARDAIFQVSTIDALLAGVYDGDMSCRDLQRHGDFGIGTFDHLDGEMILLDGNMYQIKADGKVYQPDSSVKTPFAAVCYFRPGNAISIKGGADYQEVENLIDENAPNQNLFYAIKITGRFKSMKTRSVPGQKKPYPPLKEVASNQPEFNMKNISGTIVGFRCPPFVKGVNVPGYHLHFISSDRAQGGHILSFQIASGKYEIEAINQYFLTLPEDTEEFAEVDLSKDRDKDLADVEKGK